MNKYKVGDSFIVKIKGVRKDSKYPYVLKHDTDDGGGWSVNEVFLNNLDMQVNGVDVACYNKGAEEAWEIAKQIMFEEKITSAELDKIFGTRNHFAIMRDYTPQGAKAKIEAWEKEKEIKVGDVLKHKPTGKKCVVVQHEKDSDKSMLLWADGDCDDYYNDEIECYYEKTGEHIDIEVVLKQLSE